MKKLFTSLLTLLSFTSVFAQEQDSLIVYPNPFCSTLMMHYEIAASDTVSLSIYNTVGQEVLIIHQNEILAKGFYDTTLTVTTLGDDVYTIVLKSGENTISKRAIKSCSNAIVEIDSKNGNWLLYPNPSNKEISITYTDYHSLKISDASGKLLRTLRKTESAISVKELPNGVYIVSLYNEFGNTLSSKRFIKR
jgi:hypothetical protein